MCIFVDLPFDLLGSKVRGQTFSYKVWPLWAPICKKTFFCCDPRNWMKSRFWWSKKLAICSCIQQQIGNFLLHQHLYFNQFRGLQQKKFFCISGLIVAKPCKKKFDLWPLTLIGQMEGRRKCKFGICKFKCRPLLCGYQALQYFCNIVILSMALCTC